MTQSTFTTIKWFNKILKCCSQTMRAFLSQYFACLPWSFASCVSGLRRVETESHFAYAVRITSMFLRTARFLCVLYAEICVKATTALISGQVYLSPTYMVLATIADQRKWRQIRISAVVSSGWERNGTHHNATSSALFLRANRPTFFSCSSCLSSSSRAPILSFSLCRSSWRACRHSRSTFTFVSSAFLQHKTQFLSTTVNPSAVYS